PNILMFGDSNWLPDRTDAQDARLAEWLANFKGQSLVVVECGAGTAIPTVRQVTEGMVHRFDARAIRINLRESEGPEGVLSIPMGALEALEGIAGEMNIGGGD
nr:NAD-dependent protein deacetylase [Armatimonadota bacterium]